MLPRELFYRIRNMLPQKGVPGHGLFKESHTGFEHIADAISDLLSWADPLFTSLGEKLTEAFTASGHLSGLVMKTLNPDDEKDDVIRLKDIQSLTDSVVQTLRAAEENIKAHLFDLSRGIDSLASLSRGCDSTDRLSMLLNVITLNIAVESRRSSQSSQMFEVFVQEIGQLAQRIKSVSGQLQDDVEMEKKQQQSFEKRLKQQLSNLSRLTDETQKTARESAGAIQELIHSSFESLEKANTHSSAISSKISEIVMAIQFHDILRQKLEHVIAILRTDPKAKALSISTLKVQKAQIEAVINEIQSAHDTILKSFQAIDLEANALAQCLVDAGTKKNQDSHTDLFKQTLDRMTRVVSLLSLADDLDRQIEAAVLTSSASMKKLDRHIQVAQEISLDLHRKALNAVIKSASLGKLGQSLEVLAQEVTHTSRSLDEFALTVTRIIQEVSVKADQTGGQKKSILNQSHDRLSTALQDISNEYQQFKENSEAALEPAQNFTLLLDWAESHLLFLSQLAQDLEAQCAVLDGILSSMPKDGTDSLGEIQPLPGDHLYTMESERLVHSGVMSQDQPAVSMNGSVNEKLLSGKDEKNKAEKPRAKDDPDDLGDNIDLF